MFKNKKTRFIFFNREGESFIGEPDLSETQSESTDNEEKKDLDNPDSPENRKYKEEFQKKYRDHMEITYYQDGVNYRYNFNIQPDGKTVHIEKYNLSEEMEGRKVTHIKREVTFAKLYEGRIIGMPEIKKVLESITPKEKPVENAEQAREALRKGAKEIFDKYKNMDDRIFLFEFENPHQFANTVMGELGEMAAGVIERSKTSHAIVAFIAFNGFSIGIPGPSVGNSANIGRRQDNMTTKKGLDWATRLYSEKESIKAYRENASLTDNEIKGYMSTIRRVNNYLNGPGLNYLYKNIINGRISNINLFQEALHKLMKKVTGNLPKKRKKVAMLLSVYLKEEEIYLSSEKDGTYLWEFSQGATTIAKNLLHSDREKKSKLGKSLKLHTT